MNTEWRPEGWHNNKTQNMIKDAIQKGHIAGIQGNTMYDIYEAGASAMLGALRNNQLSPFDTSCMKANFEGKVVIIPNDAVK